MLEYLDPTVTDRGAMAAECASPLGIDLVADADEPEARFLEVWRTEEGPGSGAARAMRPDTP